jgi:DNA-binding NarL/FixJ family response regulator
MSRPARDLLDRNLPENPRDLDLRPVRVLVVDDSPKVLAVVRAMLADLPGLVVAATAASAEEGLEAAPCARPDVVLLDVRMPGMGGLAAVPLFKQIDRPPLVVLLSLHADLALRREAERSGADAIMSKTELDGQGLAHLIDDLLERRAIKQRALRFVRSPRVPGCLRCSRHWTTCRRCAWSRRMSYGGARS